MILQNIGTGDFPNTGREKINDNHALLRKLLGAVAGGAGFQSVSGAITLDLDDGGDGAGAFLHTITGDITVDLANIPDGNEGLSTWFWALRMDATGDHAVSFAATVTPRNGASLANLNTDPNALNVIQFVQIGSTTYWYLLDTGVLRLSGYTMQFEGDETIGTTFEESEDVDLDAVISRAPDGSAADGTLSFERGNGTGTESVTGMTTFTKNQVLTVTRSGGTGKAFVRVPSVVTPAS